MEKKKVKFVIKEEIDDKWKIIDIVNKYPPYHWKDFFKDNIETLEEISKILEKEKRFFPLKKDIFKVFELISPKEIKVVIIGQDPYPNETEYEGEILPQATGIAFSIRDNDKLTSSLINIYKEVLNCCAPNKDVKEIKNGNLISWVRQGVLLLNSNLTVRPKEPGSHKTLWFPFIAEVIKYLDRIKKNMLFVFWGKAAKNFLEKYVEKGKVLSAAHPSGYAASKGFLGCEHFSLINEHLKENGEKPINWLSILE